MKCPERPPSQVDVEKIAGGLRHRLVDPRLLPSRQAWRRRFSPSLSFGRHFGPPQSSVRPAAVLVALEPTTEGWLIPLTMRPDHLPDHPGQISLPGGRLEADELALSAALREFHEEVGPRIPAELVVGELQPVHVFNSNYWVTPFVAVLTQPLDYVTCPIEVAELLHLPVSVLCDPQHHVRRRFTRGLLSWDALTIEYDRWSIWGATAIILADLIAPLQEAGLVSAP
ncbi:MAG: coenzyme A pyrophosphatase [Pirellulaceae bacterium]|nr:MAG: coenzyme A pyrophosphatase [Pirellulaceae bacterium]